MASAESQKPSCPVCHKSDRVKTMQAAFESGVTRCAPPDMPTRNVPMLLYMFISVLLVGIGSFAIIVIASTGVLDLGGEIAIVCIILACILTALVLSFIAFQRVVKGDNEATLRYPAWDRAMTAWRSLYYCGRDDVVFNPRTNATLSDEELASMRSIGEHEKEEQSALMASQ
jgi:hypothetical protein